MEVAYKRFVRGSLTDADRAELVVVDQLAERLQEHHDLKDLWKTHIASDAHHLFLVVPHANWNAAGGAREKPFVRVSRRLAAFFGDPRREVDVVSVHLFGYGQASLPPTQLH